MRCPKCLKEYNDNSRFCMDCGVELVDEKITPSFTPTVDNHLGSLDLMLVNKKASQYSQEAELADRVYKSYITHGISRLDKVNGRFLASQTIKLDVIIEQNSQMIEQNRTIIKLLEKISEK